MKYINAERLRARMEKLKINVCSSNATESEITAALASLDFVIRLIDSLQQEQPEMDLVTEYDEQFYSDPVYGKLVNRNAGMEIARHFYELGLNARKEE